MPPSLNRDGVIAWKTDAWKSPQMVAGYAARMRDRSGGVAIKNVVETTLIADGVAGETLLDVGIGTGRASLPLAERGMRVTGVDSSEEMLAVTRRLAGDTPIDLLPADVASLPFADGAFDSVCALNTLTHFPHWDRALAEFVRVTAPGGRIVFDLYSLEHDQQVLRARGERAEDAEERFAAPEISQYLARATVAQIVAAADAAGVRLVRLAPYGALFGHATLNRWLDPVLTGSFDRLLSYANRFPQVLRLCSVLELELLAHLDASASGRFMLTFEKHADPAANAAYAADDARKRAALARGLDAAALDACGVDVAALRAELAGLLAFAPNLVLAYRLLPAAMRARYAVKLRELAGEDAAAQLLDLVARRSDDERVAGFLTAIVEQLSGVLSYRGVPLAAAARYDLGRAILDEALQRFASPEPVR